MRFIIHHLSIIITMASFEKAWAVTSSWEGPWKPFLKRDVQNDEGDYLPYGRFGAKHYTGTSWGLTAQFMSNYRVLPDSTISRIMPMMPKDDAAKHWRETRWVWCQGDNIIDQSVATLIFDYFVQQDITAMNSIADVVLSFYRKPTFNYKKLDIITLHKYKDIKPSVTHPEPNGGYYKLSDVGIQLINNAQTQEVLFNAIKAARIKTLGSKGATKPRVKAFNYGNILTQSAYEMKLEKSGKGGGKSLMRREARNESGLQTTDAVKYGLIALGLYKGYQYVRNQK